MSNAPAQGEVEVSRTSAVRSAAIASSGLLNEAADEAFDRFTRLAQRVLQCTAAFLTVLDGQNGWVKSASWADGEHSEHLWREQLCTFCRRVVESRNAYCVEHVAEGSIAPVADRLVAYAGVPVLLDGYRIGALCVADRYPRPWPPDDVEVLRDLATGIETEGALRLERTRQASAAEQFVARNAAYKLATEVANVATFDWDIEHDHVAWSENLEALLGLPPGSFAGTYHAFLAHVHPDDRAHVEVAVQSALQTGSDYVCEFRMVRSDGSTRWSSVRGKVFRDREGVPVRMVGADWDISERMQAEGKLRENEERLRLLYESSPHPAWVFDMDSLAFLDVNPAAVALYGYSKEEFLRMRLQDIRPPEEVPFLLAYHQRVRAGERIGAKFRHRKKSGEELWVETQGQVLPGGYRGRPAVLVQITDITGLERTEDQLRASEAWFRTVANAVPAVVFVTDARGNNTFTNERYQHYAGMNAEQLLGEGWLQTIHPGDRERAASTWRKAVVTGTHYEAVYRFRRHDGAYRRFLCQGTPVRNDAGEITEWFGTAVDVEALHEAQEALRSSESMHRSVSESLTERNHQLALLARTSQLLLLGGQSEHELLKIVFQEIGQLVGMEMFYYYRLSEEPSTLRLTVFGGITEEERRFFATMRFGELLCGRVAESRARLIVEDLPSSGQPGSEVLAAAGAKSYAGFPLLVQGELLGTLAFISRRRTHFREGELQMIQAICDQVAATLERTRLLRELRASHESLRESEARYRATFETAAVGISETALDGTLLRINDGYCRLTGYSREELHGGKFQSITHPDDLARNLELWEGLKAGKYDTYEMDKRFVRKDGRVTWAHLTGSLVRGANGRPSYGVAILQNITERKRAEESLRELTKELKIADQRKDEFLAMLAHELRNPLAPIRNAVQYLRIVRTGEPNIDKMRDIIARQVTHLTRLVDDLLDVSRVTQGKVLLKKEVVDLERVVRRAVELAMPFIDAKRHALTITLPPSGVLWVDGDATRLAQVVSNLLNNAAKYTEAGGSITVSAAPESEEVVLRVQDTGTGIPAELLPRVFDLFTQADRSLDRAQGGLGIGLSLVKSLVTLHGGSVEAQSQVGVGSTFTVRLPLAHGPISDTPAVAAVPAVVPKRVLLVDDNADAAESMRVLLELEGHTVHCAADAEAALASVAAFKPEVCLLDIGLPGMNGFELARRLRALPDTRDALYIALTGYGRPEDKTRAKEAGFDHHLTKPVEPDQLYVAIALPGRLGASSG
ncbi:MAG TPA: PAS domain S-box protein [Burkholderiales bacterium]|nr:PAS domain S-box protein [Burkholderiales bacterium]